MRLMVRETLTGDGSESARAMVVARRTDFA
jgi:hypothetical protein